MNLDYFFPSKTFATAEMVEIAEAFTKPAVKKYLSQEAGKLIRDIANGLPAAGEDAESYLRRQAQVVGGLAVYEALLQIQNPSISQ
jgi:hypothetical protein